MRTAVNLDTRILTCHVQHLLRKCDAIVALNWKNIVYQHWKTQIFCGYEGRIGGAWEQISFGCKADSVYKVIYIFYFRNILKLNVLKKLYE